MKKPQIRLSERLKQLGFSRQSQIRLYGSQFELVDDPLVSSDIRRVLPRVRIPLNTSKMATEQASQAYAA
jgi:hypothetical protein